MIFQFKKYPLDATIAYDIVDLDYLIRMYYEFSKKAICFIQE